MSGEVPARVVDEIDKVEVLVEEDGSVVILEDDVLVDDRGTGIPDATSLATVGSKDGRSYSKNDVNHTFHAVQ